MGNDNTKPENLGRRKAVKTIVGGVTAVAAYNLLPAKWGKPIIEQVFLPAHAQTSGIPANAQTSEECENILFQVINNTQSIVDVLYYNCNGVRVEGFTLDEASRTFEVDPFRNVTLSTNPANPSSEETFIDDGDGPESWNGTPREINPAEHPVVTVFVTPRPN